MGGLVNGKEKKQIKNQKMIGKERYRGPLITDGASLGYLKIFPWINLPFSIFAFLAGGYGDTLGFIKGSFLICTIINLICLLLSFFPSFVNRFQSLGYIFVALMTWTMLMWLDFIGLMMFISDGSSFSAQSFYNSPLTLFYVIPMVLLFFVFCGVYAWYYLPENQGKVWKFNQENPKDKKSAFANNFWIIFGAVVLVPPLLTGYIENAFGFLAGILFTSALTAVIVDAVYAAIYVRKHPDDDVL